MNTQHQTENWTLILEEVKKIMNLRSVKREINEHEH